MPRPMSAAPTKALLDASSAAGTILLQLYRELHGTALSLVQELWRLQSSRPSFAARRMRGVCVCARACVCACTECSRIPCSLDTASATPLNSWLFQGVWLTEDHLAPCVRPLVLVPLIFENASASVRPFMSEHASASVRSNPVVVIWSPRASQPTQNPNEKPSALL